MAKMEKGKMDAAEMKPRLIPDYELLGRDDSGGPEFDPYTAEFGDGGYTTGEKSHLSVTGGSADAKKLTERDRSVRSK